MFKKIFAILYVISAVIAQISSAHAAANMQNSGHVSVNLHSDGKNELVAEVDIAKGWHIYWSNPGEIGIPTEISSLKGDLQVINQSVPQIRKAYDIMDEYIYEGKVFYHIYVPRLKDYNIKISYVECSDICKPESLSFDLEKLVPDTPEKFGEILQEAQNTFPQHIKLTSSTEQNAISFHEADPQKIKFIPASRDVIDKDSVEINHKNKKVKIQWVDLGTQKLSQALLMTANRAYITDIVYTDLIDKSLFYIIFLAFIGGIVLNAMPCVFPILSLKIFSMLQEKKSVKRHGHALAYTLGVLLCFWILTAILVILKKQGEAIGWGFQLQSPWFVGIMAIVFMILFLFMMDWLNFPDLANKFIHKTAALNAFGTGFFAVLIASPCTGPFMGAAVGYAFMQSSTKIFVIFSALALGYALPYVLIVLYPNVLNRILPRPGRWMKYLKTILAIPLLLTSLWLFSVWATQMHAKLEPIKESSLQWIDYNAQDVEEIAKRGDNVFIDFTAKWCLTCQFNDKFLLNSERFQTFVKENNVHLFKADLTEDNDTYNTALSLYGRDGIPVYVYYKDGAYKILPIFFKLSDL